MSLKDIPVHFDAGPGPASTEPTGMADALLHEVANHLLTVAQGGERQIVELGNLPLSEGDFQVLEDRLGRGEVSAEVSASGRTEVHETSFPGVWWVKYYNAGDQPAAQQLEIGTVPMILEAHPEDIQASAERFSKLFEEPERNSH
nr:hydrogenase expression/formation protein [Thioalkalivibrio sp.]